MPDPRVESIAQQFASGYETLELYEDREKAKSSFSAQLRAQGEDFFTFETLLRAGDLIGEDLTLLAKTPTVIQPITPQEARATIDDAKSGVPIWRRAISKAAAGAEWWNQNIVEPTVAVSLATAAGFIPGEQPIERRIEEAQQRIEADQSKELEGNRWSRYVDAASEAYRETDTPWGVKGTMELVLDPLNLIGMGIPGKAIKLAPALKPILIPLHVLDRAPDVVVRKIISGAAAGVGKVTGLNVIKAPHLTSQVKRTAQAVHATVSGAFTPQQFAAGLASDTAQVLGRDMNKLSQAGPGTLRNILNHIETSFPQTVAGENAWAKWLDDVHSLPPAAATAKITAMTRDLELKALVRGGTKLSGEVVEGDLRQRRVKTIGGFLEKLQIDERIATGVAEGIDNQIFLYWDTIWLRKIEPTIVRPWAVANLAFSGFFVMNVVEDVVMATLGMGGLGRKGFTDADFALITRGLPGVPNLSNAGSKTKILMDTGPKIFDEAATSNSSPLSKAVNFFKLPITWSNDVGLAIRRSAWTNRYYKEFDSVLIERGLGMEEINAMRDFIQGELPQSLEHLREEIGGKVWATVTTGNPQDIADLKRAFTSNAIIQKAQVDVLLKHPDLPVDVRRAYQQVIKDNPITSSNMAEVMQKARAELMEWHKFTAEGIRDQYSQLVSKLKVRAPNTAAEATGLLASFQTAFDTLTQLPREIQAHAKWRASLVDKVDRQKILDESLEVITTEISKARQQTTEALDLARPSIEKLLVGLSDEPVRKEAIRQSVDEMFDGYREISENLDRTWKEYRSAKDAHFLATIPEERGDSFWAVLETIGEEAWDSEYIFRADAANRIRGGWQHITDSLPVNLVPQDRQFMKNNLDAMINDAEDKINKMAILREKDLLKLETAGPRFQTQIEDRIQKTSDRIIIADAQQKALMERLETIAPLGELPRSGPKELQPYNDAIATIDISIAQATEAGLDPSTIAKLEADKAEHLAKREETFQGLIPPSARKEWDTLQSTRQELIGDPLRGPEIIENNEAISRFRQKLETGAGEVEMHRVAQGNTATINRLASRIVSENGDTSTIEAVTRQVEELAGLGDREALAFEQGLDAPSARFSDIDIVQEVIDRPVVAKWRSRKEGISKKASKDAVARTVADGGSTTNLAGQNIVAMAEKGDAPRFLVSAYPDQVVVLPWDASDIGGMELRIQQFTDDNLDLLKKRDHYVGTWHDTTKNELVLDVTVGVDSQANASRLATHHQQDAIFDVTRPVGNRVVETQNIVEPFVSDRDLVTDQLYARIIELQQGDILDSMGRSTLTRIQAGDIFPTETLDTLIEAGFVEPNPTKFANGKVRATITDAGIEAQTSTKVQRSIDDVMQNRPAPTKELDNVIDEKMESLGEINDEMLRLWDNPPLKIEQEKEVATYLNKVTRYMQGRPQVMSEFKVARQEASKRATVEYNRWFTNYDDRSSLDYVMQRFMPFWMYESRRWPRLASLAAKRPVLAKNLALIGGDWDYGYTPTVFGNEFNPFKGTGAGAVRRTLARDFPEYNEGNLGKIEQGLDWFARGAFYFNPLITSTINIAQGEAGAISPPPISLILNSMVAAGVDLPAPLHNLAFDSRYTQFVIDTVIADNYKRNPTEVRSLAENGDREAVAQLYAAEKEAAFRQIVLTQTSVLRYRPDAKREFGENMQEAIERIVGIPQPMLLELRKLGISYSEIVAVSGAQRQAILDAVPEAEVWLGASLSLKPLAEQKASRAVGDFWRAVEVNRDSNLVLQQDNSDDWVNGKISGPAALDERSALARERGAIFDSLHALPEFNEVPVTMEERQTYLTRFGKPSPMISPVDEALEQYFSITAEQFLDKRTGDINWGDYFDAQKQLIDGYDEPIRSIVEQEIRRAETILDRTLETYSLLLRQYYGVRSTVIDQMELANPEITVVYADFRRLMNFAQKANTEQERRELTVQATTLLAFNPDLSMAEAVIRQTRKRLREEDANMERAYQLFIARPGSPTSPATGTIRRQLPSRPTRQQVRR